jgi:hypothetical protein
LDEQRRKEPVFGNKFTTPGSNLGNFPLKAAISFKDG